MTGTPIQAPMRYPVAAPPNGTGLVYVTVLSSKLASGPLWRKLLLDRIKNVFARAHR
jgi:hypothetical protein